MWLILFGRTCWQWRVKTSAKGETINIGNGEPHSVNDLVKIIGGALVFVPPRSGDARYFEADNTKAKKFLGWEPTISLEEGIGQLKRVGLFPSTS